ncbi:MAG: SH3 domain-containing protein [Gemmobacter sp.]
MLRFLWALPMILAALWQPGPVAAQTLSYDHNGSGVQVAQAGRQVTITYTDPRAGLRAEGVGAGTLLFSGTMDANAYLSGMARIFRKGCGVLDYYVYGDFRAGRDFRLAGVAPVLAPTGCRVVDNSTDAAAGNLLFRVAAPAPPAPALAPRGTLGRFCVTGVQLGGALNLRSGPGTGYGVLGQIPATSCQVIGQAPAQTGWQPVMHENRLGWVAGRHLQRVE